MNSLGAIINCQYAIMTVSVLLNMFGVYCFHVNQKCNKNQKLLLQNLACIEIIKTLYDFIPQSVYHHNNDVYNNGVTYFVLIEMNVMTVLYCAFVAVTVDRLLCVSLEARYFTYVSYKLVKNGVFATWIAGPCVGLLLWFVIPNLNTAKMYYYVVCDAVVIVAITGIYLRIVMLLKRRSRASLAARPERKDDRKTPTVAILLIIMFIAFNVIPDVVVTLVHNNVTRTVMSFLWSIGYVADPLVYMFAGTKVRRIARESCVKLITRLNNKLLAPPTSGALPSITGVTICSLRADPFGNHNNNINNPHGNKNHHGNDQHIPANRTWTCSSTVLELSEISAVEEGADKLDDEVFTPEPSSLPSIVCPLRSRSSTLSLPDPLTSSHMCLLESGMEKEVDVVKSRKLVSLPHLGFSGGAM